MEKFTAPFSVKNIKADGEFFEFEGYASTFGNIDEGNDRVAEGAFTNTLEEIKETRRTIPILWQHDRWEPVGVFSEFAQDEKGLFVTGKMPKDDTFVAGRVMPQMRIGSIGKLSIGYGVRPDGAVYRDGVRELTDLDLWETSLVTFPMNTQADITAVKFSDLDFQDIRGLERALKNGVKFSTRNAKRLITAMKDSGMLRDEQTEHRDGELIEKLNDVTNLLKEF